MNTERFRDPLFDLSVGCRLDDCRLSGDDKRLLVEELFVLWQKQQMGVSSGRRSNDIPVTTPIPQINRRIWVSRH